MEPALLTCTSPLDIALRSELGWLRFALSQPAAALRMMWATLGDDVVELADVRPGADATSTVTADETSRLTALLDDGLGSPDL